MNKEESAKFNLLVLENMTLKNRVLELEKRVHENKIHTPLVHYDISGAVFEVIEDNGECTT